MERGVQQRNGAGCRTKEWGGVHNKTGFIARFCVKHLDLVSSSDRVTMT